MRSSKLQVPSSKEAPRVNGQGEVEGLWDDPEPDWVRAGDEGLMLRDDDAHGTKPFALEERTALFGEAIVKFARRVPGNPVNDRLTGQIVGAGTSVGANYCEANESVSKKDFRFSVSRCLKEAKETRHFLRMIVASEPSLASEARPLWHEATELLRILSTMKRK